MKDTKGNEVLFKVVVGSQAHCLATPKSDWDYRGVFVTPTRDIISIGKHNDQTSWIEGKEDDASWEVGKFLNLATKCNPTILEAFLAPQVEHSMFGDKVRDLFSNVWNSKDVMNSFIGYGLNQRKKFLDDKDNRKDKYATAYLRTLYNAQELLLTGTFSVDMRPTEIFDTLKRFKAGDYEIGEVIDLCFKWEKKVKDAFEKNPDKKTDLDKVNSLLQDIRYFYW